MPRGIYKRIHPPWNKGKVGVQKCSEKTREKMRINNSGDKNPFYGKRHTEESKNKNSNSHRKENLSQETLDKMSKSGKGKHSERKGIPGPLGKNAYHWKGGITGLTFQIRNSDRYDSWRTSVFERDNYICQKCGMVGRILNAHHTKRFAIILQEYNITTFEAALNCSELWETNNGTTLCKSCHDKIRKVIL